MNTHIISRTILILSLLSFCYVIALIVFPLTPLKVLNEPLPILTPQVHPGDNLGFVIEFCKHTDSPCTIRRQLINNIVYQLPEVEVNNPKGCMRQVITSTIIPKEIPPGNYKLRMVVEYKINPLRTVVVRYETQEFEVLPSEVK